MPDRGVELLYELAFALAGGHGFDLGSRADLLLAEGVICGRWELLGLAGEVWVVWVGGRRTRGRLGWRVVSIVVMLVWSNA